MKVIIGLLLSFIVLFFGVRSAATYILDRNTERAQPTLQAYALSNGFAIDSLQIAKSEFDSLYEVRWKNLSGTATLHKRFNALANYQYSFSIEELRLTARELFSSDGFLELQGVTLIAHAPTQVITSRNPSEIILHSVRYPIVLGPGGVLALRQADTLFHPLQQFLHALALSLPNKQIPRTISIQGEVEFSLGNSRFDVRLESSLVGEYREFHLNSEDLERVTKAFSYQFTEPEISLLHAQPFIAPRLLELRYRAEAQARLDFAHELELLDNRVRDAYQQVVWSYLIAKEFGEVFSKQLINTHVEGKIDSSEREREMLIVNSILGREYARRGIRFEQLKSTVENDSRVIKQY